MSEQSGPRAPRSERAERVALFRYSLIREPVRVSRVTLDRWIRAYATGGYAALLPTPPHVVPRTPADVLDLAAAIKAEELERSAAQVAEVLRVGYGWAPSPRTLQRHFRRTGLAPRGPADTLAYGRFEASRVNEPVDR